MPPVPGSVCASTTSGTMTPGSLEPADGCGPAFAALSVPPTTCAPTTPSTTPASPATAAIAHRERGRVATRTGPSSSGPPVSTSLPVPLMSGAPLVPGRPAPSPAGPQRPGQLLELGPVRGPVHDGRHPGGRPHEC